MVGAWAMIPVGARLTVRVDRDGPAAGGADDPGQVFLGSTEGIGRLRGVGVRGLLLASRRGGRLGFASEEGAQVRMVLISG